MSIRDALLNGAIDYAGLFPPAGEDMQTAVGNYAEYAYGPDRAALGRFIVPLARMAEFEDTGADRFPRGSNAQPWKVSVLISDDVRLAAQAIADFNARHSGYSRHGAAIVDVAELKASTVEEIANQQRDLPRTLTSYYEIPVNGDVPSLVQALSEVSSRAKVRTGGLTPDAFPSAESIIDFMFACHAVSVPFKATAGLHHPIRGEYRLTYEPGSPRGMMYGFLNVFLAATLIAAGQTEEVAQAALEETSPAAFEFHGDCLQWRDNKITSDQLAATRAAFAISFGSCSFREPIDELAGLLRPAQPART